MNADWTEAIAADTPEHVFEMAGGFDYIDRIALALDAQWRKQSISGVMVSRMELAWLLDGYARARRRVSDPRPTEAEARKALTDAGLHDHGIGFHTLQALGCFCPADRDEGER